MYNGKQHTTHTSMILSHNQYPNPLNNNKGTLQIIGNFDKFQAFQKLDLTLDIIMNF